MKTSLKDIDMIYSQVYWMSLFVAIMSSELQVEVKNSGQCKGESMSDGEMSPIIYQPKTTHTRVEEAVKLQDDTQSCDGFGYSQEMNSQLEMTQRTLDGLEAFANESQGFPMSQTQMEVTQEIVQAKDGEWCSIVQSQNNVDFQNYKETPLRGLIDNTMMIKMLSRLKDKEVFQKSVINNAFSRGEIIQLLRYAKQSINLTDDTRTLARSLSKLCQRGMYNPIITSLKTNNTLLHAKEPSIASIQQSNTIDLTETNVIDKSITTKQVTLPQPTVPSKNDNNKAESSGGASSSSKKALEEKTITNSFAISNEVLRRDKMSAKAGTGRGKGRWKTGDRGRGVNAPISNVSFNDGNITKMVQPLNPVTKPPASLGQKPQSLIDEAKQASCTTEKPMTTMVDVLFNDSCWKEVSSGEESVVVIYIFKSVIYTYFMPDCILQQHDKCQETFQENNAEKVHDPWWSSYTDVRFYDTTNNNWSTSQAGKYPYFLSILFNSNYNQFIISCLIAIR